MTDAITVTGAAGLLGANLVRDFALHGLDVRAVTHRYQSVKYASLTQMCDLGAPGVQPDLERVMAGCSCVVHCAAISNVDWCESHPEAARAVNVEGSAQVARAAVAAGCRMVYISTDAVFDGSRGPYAEQDATHPLNEYGRSKLEGEEMAAGICPSCLVVRTNMFGWNARPKESLAEWMLNRLRAGKTFTAFEDIRFNPLLVNDLGDALLDLVKMGMKGTLHLGARDSCTKYEFATRIADLFGGDAGLIRRGSSSAAALRAVRSRAPVLSVDLAQKKLGRQLPDVDGGLRRFKDIEDDGSTHDIRSLVGEARDDAAIQD